MAGAALVWFAPLMFLIAPDKSPIQMTITQNSWLMPSIDYGSLLIVIPAGIMADKIGRKYPLLMCGPLYAISYLLLGYNHSLLYLFVLRQIQGICMGVAYTCSPIYIAELSEPWLRGFNSCNIMTMFYLGGLFSYCIGPYVSYEDYTLISVALPLIFSISFTYMPESPYYLLMKGRYDDAEKALSWFRGDMDVEEELNAIQDTVQKETNGKDSWRELFLTRKDRKAFLIIQICCITKYLGGITAFFTYESQTVGGTTISLLDHNQFTITAGVILSLAAFISSLTSISVGRRPMLIYSCLICFFFYFLTGWYYFLDSKTDFEVKPYVSVLYISVFGFLIASTMGIAPLMQTIQSEYFSASTRGIGGGMTLATAALLTIFSVKQYQFIADTVGVYLNYWIYAVISLWGTICLYFFLPETSGRSLCEIQSDLTESNER